MLYNVKHSREHTILLHSTTLGTTNGLEWELYWSCVI